MKSDGKHEAESSASGKLRTTSCARDDYVILMKRGR